MLCIMMIIPYKFSSDDIGNLKKMNNDNPKIFNRFLPEYTINEKGIIVETDYYLQYIDEGSEEFILFDIHSLDPMIENEIDYGNAWSELDFRPVFDRLELASYECYQRTIPNIANIFIEIEWVGSRDEDWESEISIYGILKEKQILKMTDPYEPIKSVKQGLI